jgi:uncharacterized protein (DUF58 family)
MPTAEAPTKNDLFDARFLESLKTLRIIARRVPRQGRPAEQRSRDMGAGTEFRDFRPYSPGDDFRAIDWNLYRRLGKVFLRLFEELEDLPLYLMPDVSRSMYLESPPRAIAGLRTALALASISLNQLDSVGLFPFSNDIGPQMRPRSGKRQLMTVANFLADLEPGGQTDFARSMKTFSTIRLRQGLVVIVSDFFDPSGLDSALAALKRLRHRVLLVQLVRGVDRDPEIRGDVRVVDCETSTAEDVTVSAAVLAKYRAAYDAFQDRLTKFALARSAGLLRLDADKPVAPQLAKFFETGEIVV